MRIYNIKRIRFHQMRTKTNFSHELKFKVELMRRFSKMYEARFSKKNTFFDKWHFFENSYRRLCKMNLAKILNQRI